MDKKFPASASVSDGDEHAIAVIGMAAWYPCGQNLKDFWSGILARRRAFRRIPDQRLNQQYYYDADPAAVDKTYVNQAALIDGFKFDWVKHRIPKQIYETADVVHWLALDLAIRAVADAGYGQKPLPKESTGVIIGNTLTGEVSRANGMRVRWPYVLNALRHATTALNYPEEVVEQLAEATEYLYKSAFPAISEDTLSGTLPGAIAGQICNYFDLKGGAYSVDGACSSSLIAIATSADALVNRELDVAFAGGVDISIDALELIGFAKIGALTKDEMLVYDRNSRGFFPGEGGGLVVLKRLEDARRDGDYIYAALRGWALSSNGRGGVTAPSKHGQVLAIQRAYAKSGYTLRDVDFVEGHGTGTPVGDEAELQALAAAFESAGPPRGERCGITALKPIIGHTKAAAGVGSFIKAVLAVNQRVIPPLTGCRRPHEVFSNHGSHIYPALRGEVKRKDHIMRAGVTASGFGGINVHVTVESAGTPSPALKPSIEERALFVSSQDSELFLLAGETPDALAESLVPLIEMARGISLAELTDLAAHLAQNLNQEVPVRAAVIASHPEELARQFETLAYMLKTPPPPETLYVHPAKVVWLGRAFKDCRVGFVFPGQGAQYLNMARALVERFEWARELVATADKWVGEINGEALSKILYRDVEKAGGGAELDVWNSALSQTEVCQPAVCLASVLWMEFLKKVGIEPAAVGGYSLGELTAFHAAGGFDCEQLIRLAALRGKSMAAPSELAGAMAALGCSRDAVLDLLRQVGEYVVVSGINSDKQVTVSGSPEAIADLLRIAREARVTAQKLPVSNGFHSRYMERAASQLRASTEFPCEVGPLSCSLYSSVDGGQVRGGLNAREHLARQVMEPVDFISLIKSLAGETDMLVEVGPGRTLTGFTSAIAGAGPATCLPVEIKEGEFESFNKVVASYFVLGGQVNVSALFERRLVYDFMPPAERHFIENPCERKLPPLKIAGAASPSQLSNFGSGLHAQIGVEREVLDKYLARRGKFISDVIRADINSSNPELESDASARPSGQFSNGGAPRNGSAQARGETQPAEDDETPKAELDVEATLINLISERTGFPPESLKPEMALLGDLNIESIAAAEIITRLAREAGVGGKLDPSPLLRATLREVTEAVGKLRDGLLGELPSRPGDVAGVEPEMIGETMERLTGKKSWVRGFEIRYEEESLSLDDESRLRRTAEETALIICEQEEAAQAEAIALALAKYNLRVETRTFAEAADGNLHLLAGADKPRHVLVMLPKLGGELTAEHVRSSLLRLKSSARCLPPRASELPDSLTYLHFGGGHFGTRPCGAEGQAFSALSFVASVHHEHPALKCRVLDLSTRLGSDDVAMCVAAELTLDERFIAAGYDEQRTRRVPRPRLKERCDSAPREISWSPEDVIVVTGGAKGITAELAFAMAEKTRARMALIGRTPCPDEETGSGDREILNTLERFRQAGLRCVYYSCDVADRADVAQTFERIRADLGPTTGLLHGAGVNKIAKFGSESLEDAGATLCPKVLGFLNVCEQLGEQVKLVSGLSSIVGVVGLPGNAWYALSNEWLDLLLRQYARKHPEKAVISIAYSLWEETGMGVKLDNVLRYVQRMGTSSIPVSEGVGWFLHLLSNDAGAEQVIVAARLGGLDTWRPASASRKRLKFLDEIVTAQPKVEAVVRARLSLDGHAYLKDHVYKGTYLLPMVFSLEAMAQAVLLAADRPRFGYVRLENIALKRPIIVDEREGERLFIHAEVLERSSPDGELRVAAGIASEQTNCSVDYVTATFVLRDGFSPDDVPVERVRKPARPLNLNPTADLYGRFLFHGPSFQRLQKFYVLKSDYCVFRSEAKDLNADDGFVLEDPYFVDSLLQAGQIVLSQDRGLPCGIRSFEIYPRNSRHTKLPLVVGVLNERDQSFVDCNITATDNQGRVLLKMENCKFSIIEHDYSEPTAEEIAAPDERDRHLLETKLSRLSSLMGISVPSVTLANLPGLHDLPAADRHSREEDVIQQAVQGFLLREREHIGAEANSGSSSPTC